MFDIGKVANCVVEAMGLTGEDIDTVWNDFINDNVKNEISLSDVKRYIAHKQELGRSEN